MAEQYEYHDYLKDYMTERVKDFVEDMGDNAPDELKEVSKENLIHNLTDNATPILRGLEDDAIRAACYHLTSMIRLAKQHPADAKGRIK